MDRRTGRRYRKPVSCAVSLDGTGPEAAAARPQFCRQGVAFNAGYERVKGLRYEIIGNLDGDISFDRDHFEFLARKFSQDPALGVAGTVFREEGYSSEKTASKGASTFRVSASCSAGNAGSKSAAIFRTAPGESTGWR